MTKSRNILAPRRPWAEWEIALLRAHYADSLTADLARALGRSESTTYQQANKIGLFKSPAFVAAVARERSLQAGHGSHAHRFAKDHVPANKGLRRPGWAPGDMARTQFKPGRPACEASNYLPIDSLRLSKDGYLERKVTDDRALAPARRWVAVHRLVWEAEHGPIAAGHAVAFKPCRKTTELALITPDALECVSRAELMRRNSYHRYGPDVAAVVQLRGAITRQINQRTREPT